MNVIKVDDSIENEINSVYISNDSRFIYVVYFSRLFEHNGKRDPKIRIFCRETGEALGTIDYPYTVFACVCLPWAFSDAASFSASSSFSSFSAPLANSVGILYGVQPNYNSGFRAAVMFRSAAGTEKEIFGGGTIFYCSDKLIVIPSSGGERVDNRQHPEGYYTAICAESGKIIGGTQRNDAVLNVSCIVVGDVVYFVNWRRGVVFKTDVYCWYPKTKSESEYVFTIEDEGGGFARGIQIKPRFVVLNHGLGTVVVHDSKKKQRVRRIDWSFTEESIVGYTDCCLFLASEQVMRAVEYKSGETVLRIQLNLASQIGPKVLNKKGGEEERGEEQKKAKAETKAKAEPKVKGVEISGDGMFYAMFVNKSVYWAPVLEKMMSRLSILSLAFFSLSDPLPPYVVLLIWDTLQSLENKCSLAVASRFFHGKKIKQILAIRNEINKISRV